GLVGYEQLSTSISCAEITMSQACRKFSTSNELSSALKNFIKSSEAKLQALSSINMYSLHGFDALIRCVVLTGFQRLIVVSYCIPGSPQTQAASEIFPISSRALYLRWGLPVMTSLVHHSPSSSTVFMNSSVTRTEWLAFW